MRLRRLQAALSIALVLNLGFAHAFSGGVSQAPNVWQQVTLESQYYQYLTFPGNITAVSFETVSNATVAIMLMTSSQFNDFQGTGPVTWIYGQNGTQAQDTAGLSLGATNYLVFWAYGPSAEVNYTVQTYQFGDLPSPQPSGLAAYGISNSSGTLSSYTVSSTAVAGTADIYALTAYNATAAKSNSSTYGASLQLNSVIAVTDRDGLVESYWCQDVPTFITNSSSWVDYVSNIWNDTSPGAPLTNSSVTSPEGGYVTGTTVAGTSTDFYANSSPYSDYYRLPLDLVMIMNDSVLPGTGVQVSFGVQVLKNGTRGAAPIYWFDTAVIHDTQAVAASFYVSGAEAPGSGNFYDTELVFGGEGNGESTSFNAMNATLGLFYSNGAALVAYPSMYSVGGDTTEGSDNLHVTSHGSTAVVSVGRPDYSFLGNFTGTLSVPGLALTTPEFPQAVLGLVMALAVATVALAGRLARSQPRVAN